MSAPWKVKLHRPRASRLTVQARNASSVETTNSVCKVLVWDGTGLCIFQKRLERGRFAALWREDGAVVHLTASELALFIEGCDLVGRRTLSPGVVKPKPLALDRTA
jgi:hypothetical protein